MDKTATVNLLATGASVKTVSVTSQSNDGHAPIVGAWRETSFEYEEFINNVSQGVVNSGTINALEATTIVFNADGTFTESCIEIMVTGTYSINGDILTITYESDDTSELVFTLKDNRLMVAYTDESINKNNDMVKCTTTTILDRQ